jgi:hypothetical protein
MMGENDTTLKNCSIGKAEGLILILNWRKRSSGSSVRLSGESCEESSGMKIWKKEMDT